MKEQTAQRDRKKSDKERKGDIEKYKENDKTKYLD